jgi:hypothetical protein
MANEGDGVELAGRYFAIALLPVLMFFINLWLLGYAEPPDALPARIAEFAAWKEASARIGVLASLMLFAGAAVAALLFFAVSVRAIVSRQRWILIACLVALALAAALSGRFLPGKTTVDYAGSSLTRLAAGYDQARSDAAREAEKKKRAEAEARRPQAKGQAGAAQPNAAPAAVQLPSGVAVELLPRQEGEATRFLAMVELQERQFEATNFAFAALIMAAILCLAGPPRRSAAATAGSAPGSVAAAPVDAPSDTAEELQHWEEQSERLNYCLYLSALLLGTSLLFINAYLSWPGYLLTEHGDHDAYIRTLVSYYGFTFTVMLASFYIPVAAILTARVKKLSGLMGGEAKRPDAFKGPLQILKIVLGLFSTAVAGVLPALIDQIG